eukprot:1383844-Amorphochlora_amoeboformis.AAC.2
MREGFRKEKIGRKFNSHEPIAHAGGSGGRQPATDNETRAKSAHEHIPMHKIRHFRTLAGRGLGGATLLGGNTTWRPSTFLCGDGTTAGQYDIFGDILAAGQIGDGSA